MKIPTIIVVLLAIFFVFKFGYLDQRSRTPVDDVKEIKESLDRMEQADTIDEIVETVNIHNREAARDFEKLQQLAKSDASREFVAITAEQNRLAESGQELVRKMQPLINGIGPDLQDNPEKTAQVYATLCIYLGEYIPVLEELLGKIRTKQQLIHSNPEVSEELYGGQQDKMFELIDYLYSNQNRVYEGEKQAYIDLQCDGNNAGNQPADTE